MAYAVQLYMDPKTEALIKQVWDKLAEKGLSDNMIKKGGRPNVGVSVSSLLGLLLLALLLLSFSSFVRLLAHHRVRVGDLGELEVGGVDLG